VGLLAVAFIAWHFYSKGLLTSSVASEQELTPQKGSPTYKPAP